MGKCQLSRVDTTLVDTTMMAVFNLGTQECTVRVLLCLYMDAITLVEISGEHGDPVFGY